MTTVITWAVILAVGLLMAVSGARTAVGTAREQIAGFRARLNGDL